MPFRRASVTSPSNSIFSSLEAMTPPFRGSDGPDVRRLGAFLTLAGLELDPRAFLQRLEALAEDVRVVDEEVLAALVGRDEPVPLRVVEPLHDSGCHVITSLTCHERVREARQRHRYSLSVRQFTQPAPPFNPASQRHAARPATRFPYAVPVRCALAVGLAALAAASVAGTSSAGAE